MTNTRRRVGIAALLVPLVLILSSCMRMKMDVTIDSADDIEVAVDIGVDKNFAMQGGGTSVLTGQQLCDRQSVLPSSAKAEPYEDEKYIGCRIASTATMSTFANATFDEKSGRWTFHMRGGDLGSQSQQMNAGVISDFKVSVTFPGKVLEHSGTSTVSGTTVTWADSADLYKADGLKAVSDSSGAGGSMLLRIVLGIVALAAIVAAAWFVATRKKPTTEAAQHAVSGPMPGFGPSSAPAPGLASGPGAVPPPWQGGPGNPAPGPRPVPSPGPVSPWAQPQPSPMPGLGDQGDDFFARPQADEPKSGNGPDDSGHPHR